MHSCRPAVTSHPPEDSTITDALFQWRFKPYLREGQPLEVESGIMFGRAPPRAVASAPEAVSE
jgi:hypothetical protein